MLKSSLRLTMNHAANRINYPIIIIYLLSSFFLYPAFAHIIMYEFGWFTDRLPHGGFWENIQLFVTSPACMTLGMILFFNAGRSTINKVVGVLLILFGVYWLTDIVMKLEWAS